jgi:predicted SnoaL-like aldol condensation-catalyzing enzyme
MPDFKAMVLELLKSIETGDTKPLAYINPQKYIQHNPNVADGLDGFKELLATRKAGAAKVATLRIFQDGDFVLAHSEYHLAVPMIGFDVFRFEDGKIVEHWDNKQEKASSLSPSGHSMTDGPCMATDLEKTESNKALMRRYMDDLLQGRKETFSSYFDGINYIQHSPLVADNLTGLFAGLQELATKGLAVKYRKVHRIIGEGNFVLVMAEGSFGETATAYYDFYRIQDGKIAEHWDTLESIPPVSLSKNLNGKF